MNILVTGGASGLGKAIVETLAKEKQHNIYFTFNASAKEAAALEKKYSGVTSIKCDFTDEQQLEGLLNALPIMELDILVNNASGKFEQKHFHKVDPAHFSITFQRNILPVLRITQEVIKGFRKKKWGKIINIISSAVVNKPPVGWSAYAANKSYLLAMSKAWATENVGFNITSNAISPAFMKTSFTAAIDERLVEMMAQKHPLKKLLQPDEVAEAVLYFSNASQQVNGTHLVINAGEELV